MLPLFKFLKSFFTRTHTYPRPLADETYLNQAVDIYDLERRMRALEDGRRDSLYGVAFGLYPR
jgi:hypothetical protein